MTNAHVYNTALAAGKIDRAFILLVCKSQELLGIDQDGKIGSGTAKAFEKFTTGGEHGINYTRLFKDRKLEIGIGIGYEFGGEMIDGKKQSDEAAAIVSMLKATQKNTSSTILTDRTIVSFTKLFAIQGDNTASPVSIDVIIELITSKNSTPKSTFTKFLSQKEITIYSGHARYGTSPDFDNELSVKENFVIGVNSALHKAGKLTSGYDSDMNKILEKQANDLEKMSKEGKIDPNTYQIWFFNACSSIQYMDEVRKGLVTDKKGNTKSTANLRFAGTKHTIQSDAVEIVRAIVNMKSMDEIISIMDTREKKTVEENNKLTPNKKEPIRNSYFFAD